MAGKKGTTDQGVPNDAQNTEEAEPMVIRRLPRPGFADVIESREKQFSDETGEDPDDPENIDEGAAYANATDEDEEKPAPEPVAEVKPETAPAPEEAPAPEAPPAAPAAEEEMVELTIDGEKVKRPKSELPDPTQALQMKLAAERKFQEAARLRKEAEEISARREQPEPVERAPQAPVSEPAPAPTPAVDLASLRKEVAEKRAAAIQASNYGDESEQVGKWAEFDEAQRKLVLEEVRAEIGHKAPPVHEIAQQVKREIDESVIREKAVTIRNRFEKDFSDIAGDPGLFELARVQVNREIASGADGTDYATYEKAGNMLRQWVGIPIQAPSGNAAPAAPVQKAPPVDQSLQSRADRKRQVPPVPTANQRSDAPQDEPDEDVQSTVREIARRRVGQS